jgi:hypothetical protein
MKTVAQKRRHTAYKIKIRKFLEEKIGKQNNSWPVC